MNATICDYCGTTGCHWSLHDEARADVRAFQRTQADGLDAEYAREHQPACPACRTMPAGRACVQHTCLDCGKPADYVHGRNGEPCPA